MNPFYFPEDLLKQYNLKPFHIELLRHMHEPNCDRAIKEWNDSWDFCPSCGRAADLNGVITHRSKGEASS